MSALVGSILTTDGWIDGALQVDASGRIIAIEGTSISEDAVRSRSVPMHIPGFIDVHVHGAGGCDIMEAGGAAVKVAQTHARHGTTALLATTMTAPMEDLIAAFEAMAEMSTTRAANASRVLGVHLEGPYINPGKLGAQPDFARPLAVDELAKLNAITPIRLITLAPEVPGNLEAIRQLVAAGYRVQLGHSLASYEEGVAAMNQGAQGFTHLFNAMTGLHHRKPGLVGAALAHAEYAEIIPDLLHVHEGAIHVAMRAIPKLFCVTDSTSATGMPDGEYRLGRNTVTKCMGGVRLADGTLAGSTLTMDQALRNLVERLSLSIAQASARVSTHAADYLGLIERGRLAPGAWADVVTLDRDLQVRGVLVEGTRIE